MLTLKIATPEKEIYNQETSKVIVKTLEGEISIYPNHLPYLSIIKDGYVKLEDETIEIKSGSIILDDNNIVTILIENQA